MSLSDDLRGELAAIDPARACDRLAELSALFHGAGALRLHGRGRSSAVLDVADPAVARRAFTLLRSFGAAADIRTYRRRSFARATRFQLTVDGGGRALQVLHEAGIVSAAGGPLEAPPQRVVGRACCRRAYLRGALLAAGSLSGPRSPHLEIRTATRAGARFLAGVAAAEDLTLAVAERERHAVAYAKGTAAIAALLLAAGANDLVLALEERAVTAATRSHANRLANADHANLVRTSRAAQRQLRAIERLAADGVLQTLSEPLQDIAALRVEHPSASLAALAERADPAITKASAQRRLERLVRFAESAEAGFGRRSHNAKNA